MRSNQKDSDQMNLFDWTPPRQIIVFPMSSRVGRIREVAGKMVMKSQAQAEFYVKQVTEGMIVQLEKLGLSNAEQGEQIDAFWLKVENEMTRLTYGRSTGSNNPRGAA